MNTKQNGAGLFQRASTLNGDLPKVWVEGQHDARRGFREIQQVRVFRPGEICARPQKIVAAGSKLLYNSLRKVLAAQEAHLRRNRERLVLVRQIAGVGETREDVLSPQARIVGENFLLRLASCQKFQNELDRQARSADNWFGRQDLRVDDNALRHQHKHNLP